MTRRALGGAGAIAAMLGLGTNPANAQISPGPLSWPHAELEGSGSCGRCHEPGRGVAPEKCLSCHGALDARIRAGKGLHARPEYGDCKTCHIDHQGEEYELVWWGKPGREAFDHLQTGHPLEGRHARLACRDCHKPELNHRQQALSVQRVDLTRTYLGLATACTDCHADEHRGQFPDHECNSCHGQSAWQPASGFDHAKTSWPLSGRHSAVACAECHRQRSPDPTNPAIHYVQFRSVSGRECSSCHEDVHRARLGPACASCHSTADWRRVERARFDHERTGYPLAGRHSDVACERCHPRGASRPLERERCAACHDDAHFGQLAARRDGGACESCHDVNGFSPARYALDEHQKTTYPLTGGHLAVACNACHVPVTVAELRKAASFSIAPGASGSSPKLRFASTTCADCHRDAHHGELDSWMKAQGCQGCHSRDSWRAASASFDHGRTSYPLVGEHSRAACGDCHRKIDPGTPRERIHFTGLSAACRDCHDDPHGGQFEESETASSCQRCHEPDTLQASRFDHARNSKWPLDGAHARVPCQECHRRVTRDGVAFVRYKPVPTTCRGCHAPTRLRGKEIAAR